MTLSSLLLRKRIAFCELSSTVLSRTTLPELFSSQTPVELPVTSLSTILMLSLFFVIIPLSPLSTTSLPLIFTSPRAAASVSRIRTPSVLPSARLSAISIVPVESLTITPTPVIQLLALLPAPVSVLFIRTLLIPLKLFTPSTSMPLLPDAPLPSTVKPSIVALSAVT